MHGLSCTSNIVHLHCLQINFSNNSIGSLSNGVTIQLKLGILTFKALHAGCPPYLSDLLHITNPLGLILFSSAFGPPVTTYLLDLVLFDFLLLSLEFITCQHPRISVTSYHQTSSKDISLIHSYFQSAYPISAAHLA